MEKLKLSVAANEVSIVERKAIISGTHGDTMSVTFSDDWNDYLIRAVWQFQQSEPLETVETSNGIYDIPDGVIKQSGYFKVGFYGTNGEAVTPTVWSEPIPILHGVPTGLENNEPYPTLYDKISKEKQDKLVGGNGIKIDGNTISSTSSFIPGDGNKIEGNVISATGNSGDGLTDEMKTALNNLLKLCAFTSDPSTAYKAFKTAFGITDGGDEPTPDPEPGDDSPPSHRFDKVAVL